MKLKVFKSSLTAIATMTLLAGCSTTHRVPEWEYKVALHSAHGAQSPEAVVEQRQQFLNELGKQGWFLVSESDGRVFYLMRPKK